VKAGKASAARAAGGVRATKAAKALKSGVRTYGGPYYGARLEGEPPIAKSRGWGDMSWLRRR
jgi:hypothetical protein